MRSTFAVIFSWCIVYESQTGIVPGTREIIRGTIEFSYGDFIVNWELNEEKTRIMIDATVLGQGWFGVGFSEEGTMVNADMAVAQVVTNEQGVKVLDLKDYHSITYNNVPKLDTVQNLEDVRTGRNDSYSYFHFSRQLNTGDNQDSIVPLNGIHVLYAFSDVLETMEYHRRDAGSEFVIFDELS